MQALVPILWIVFLVAIALYAVYGVILMYHWRKWSHSPAATATSILAYSIVGAGLSS